MKKSIFSRQSVPQGIAEILAAEIAEKYQPGEALATVQSLSERFGVSVATIRNALLILSKDGIVESIHGSGTYVRDVSHLKHIALLTQMDAANFHKMYFFWRMIQHANDLLERKGIPVRCYTGYGQIGKRPPEKVSLDFLHALQSNSFMGVVAIGVCDHTHLVPLLKKHQVPCVGLSGSDFFVGVNFDKFIRSGLEELATQGRKRVAVFANQLSSQDFPRYIQQQALALGLEIRPEWIQTDLVAGRNDGWTAFKALWSGFGAKPDGMLCLDDVLFNDMFMALVELGVQVPAQLAIVCHSNHGSGLHYPIPITQFEFSPEEQAEMVVDALLRILDGNRPTKSEAELPFRILRPTPGSTSTARSFVTSN